MRRPALAILAASFLAAPTCSNTSQPSADALAIDLARAFCQHQFRCCSPLEIAVSGAAGTT
jgi:hypothetical protein